MRDQKATTGAMPGPGAMPAQVYPVGPGWAPYRLPFPGVNSFTTARGAGIVFDGEGGGGAGGDGGAGDPPPPGTPPATPPAGGEDQLGEAGKAALQRERDARAAEKRRADEAEKKLTELTAAGQSETEKAIAQARKEAAAEVQAKADSKVRNAEVRRALQAAGCVDAEVAARSPEFAELGVDEEGAVPDLEKTLKTYRTAHPSLFARAATGSGDGGAHGDQPPKAKTLEDAVGAHYTK